jgi:hypothetical protein
MNFLYIAMALVLRAPDRPPLPPIVGCAAFQINGNGGKHVSVRKIGGCVGSRLSIVVDSSASYDSVRRIVSLPIVLVNDWSREIAAPFRLYAWPESIRVASFGGPSAGPHRPLVEFAGADRPADVRAGPFPGALAWSFDALVIKAGGKPEIPPGKRSRSRIIRIALAADGPMEFAIVLRATGENAHPFPEDPPRLTASDVVPGAAVVVDAEGLPPGRVLTEFVEVRFPPRMTYADRQAEIDAMRGTVIGASPKIGPEERTYIVRLAPDSAKAPVRSALSQYAFPIVLDSLLAPEFRRSPLYVMPESGCSTIRLRISGASVETAPVVAPSCGPLVPILDDGASYDPRTKRLVLRIRLENEWMRAVAPPLRLFAWNEQVGAISPPPARQPYVRGAPRAREFSEYNGASGERVRWTDADSAIGGGASELASAQIWRFDGQPTGLEGRSQSQSREIVLTLIDTTVREFTIELRARAENAHPVPGTAPNTGDPPDAYRPDHRIADRAGFGPAPIMDDLIDITFSPGDSREDRQAVIDSIDGRVVGGFHRFGRDDGTYVVRIEGDSSGRNLAAALAKLRAMHAALAMPVEVAGAAAERGRGGLPKWLLDDSAQFKTEIEDYSKRAIEVDFHYGVSRQAVHAALDSVHAKILIYPAWMGTYLLLIPAPGSLQDLERVLARLDSMPQVSWALPHATRSRI